MQGNCYLNVLVDIYPGNNQSVRSQLQLKVYPFEVMSITICSYFRYFAPTKFVRIFGENKYNT